MRRGLRAEAGILDDAYMEELECPNCGKKHLRVIMPPRRGDGKSTMTMINDCGFCDINCLNEFINRWEMIQNESNLSDL